MIVLEIGPHPVVSTMIQATSPGTEVLPCSKRKVDLWEVIASTISTLYMAGAEIVWREFHRDFKGAHKVMRLPAYKWDLKKYWMQYVNDWSLRKGDPLVVQPTPSYGTTASAPTPPRPESTTIHRFVEETVNDEQGTIVVESDISRSDLNPMVQGHKVNGIPLCTPVSTLIPIKVLNKADRNMHSPSTPILHCPLASTCTAATGLISRTTALSSLTWSSRKRLLLLLAGHNSCERQ